MSAKHLSGESPDELPGQGGTGGAGLVDGDFGDITVSGSGTTMTIDNKVVTNAKLADVPTATLKGRTTAGTGDPEDLTATQATALLNTFTSVDKGLAPASGGGTANFLRADGTWAVPPTPAVPASADICLSSMDGTGQTFTFSAAVFRQLTLQTAIFNPAANYNTSTGRYTPTVAGVYEINGTIQTPNISAFGIPAIYKNGAIVASGTYISSASAAGQRTSVTALIYMNGTTDYLELWGYSSAAGTTAAGNGQFMQFNARLVST